MSTEKFTIPKFKHRVFQTTEEERQTKEQETSIEEERPIESDYSSRFSHYKKKASIQLS